MPEIPRWGQMQKTQTALYDAIQRVVLFLLSTFSGAVAVQDIALLIQEFHPRVPSNCLDDLSEIIDTFKNTVVRTGYDVHHGKTYALSREISPSSEEGCSERAKQAEVCYHIPLLKLFSLQEITGQQLKKSLGFSDLHFIRLHRSAMGNEARCQQRKPHLSE